MTFVRSFKAIFHATSDDFAWSMDAIELTVLFSKVPKYDSYWVIHVNINLINLHCYNMYWPFCETNSNTI
jgi:hypothetical protein